MYSLGGSARLVRALGFLLREEALQRGVLLGVLLRQLVVVRGVLRRVAGVVVLVVLGGALVWLPPRFALVRSYPESP